MDYPVPSPTSAANSTSESDGPPRLPTSPDSKNIDGRPVWEPPCLAYNALIGDEFDKRREAALKYTGGDAARTTEILDFSIEWDLYNEYDNWVDDNVHDAEERAQEGLHAFWKGLMEELYEDFNEGINGRYNALHIEEVRNPDGTWVIRDRAYLGRVPPPTDSVVLPQVDDEGSDGSQDSSIASSSVEESQGSSSEIDLESIAKKQPRRSADEKRGQALPLRTAAYRWKSPLPQPLAMHLVSLSSRQEGNRDDDDGGYDSSAESEID